MADFEKDDKMVDLGVEGNEEENREIMLEDENGELISFTVIGTYELDGVIYFALVETDELETSEEVLIMRVTGEGEEMELISIDDEDELNRAFDEFVRLDEEGEL